jgi:hypothetical protein
MINNSTIDSDTWTIEVNLNQVADLLEFSGHTGPALYQINRLASSALSCYVTETTTFLDLVRFNFNLPVNGLNGGDYLPLRAFTKKPQYDINGNAKYSDGTLKIICDPYCDFLTAFLTISDESCMDAVNSQTLPCNNNRFGTVPPFTDLTYPLDKLPTVHSSPETKPVLIIVLSVIGGVLLLAIVVISIVFIIHRRRRRLYQELPTKP